MRKLLVWVLVISMLTLTSACAGLTPTQQRLFSGGTIGAGAGAVIGAATGGSAAAGAAIGGAGGVVGGAIVDVIHRGY